MVASEQVTPEAWHSVQQDVLLTLDPEAPEDVHAERLIGDMLLETAQMEKLEPDIDMRGAERGEWASNFADQVAGRAQLNFNGAAPLNGRVSTPQPSESLPA